MTIDAVFIFYYTKESILNLESLRWLNFNQKWFFIGCCWDYLKKNCHYEVSSRPVIHFSVPGVTYLFLWSRETVRDSIRDKWGEKDRTETLSLLHLAS